MWSWMNTAQSVGALTGTSLEMKCGIDIVVGIVQSVSTRARTRMMT